MFYRHPDPDGSGRRSAGARLWERRRDDDDFGVVRIGLGPQELADAARPAADPAGRRARTVVRRWRCAGSSRPTRSCPTCRSRSRCAASRRIYLRGDRRARSRGLVRAMLAQLATFHAPDDLLIAVCAAPTGAPTGSGSSGCRTRCTRPAPTRSARSGWSRRRRRAGGDARRPAGQPAAVRPAATRARSPAPHLVVVIDGGDVAGSDHLMTERRRRGRHASSTWPTAPPRLLDRASLVLDVDADGTLTQRPRWTATTELGRADALRPGRGRGAGPAARAAAAVRTASRRRAAAHRRAGPGRPARPRRPVRVRPGPRLGPAGPTATGCGCRSASAPTARRSSWTSRSPRRTAWARTACSIGATGSGKSELLRTLVLALAVTHSSEIAQLRPGRLQGRRDVRLAGPAAAHQRGDHQPRRRAAAGRPDARRDPRRADPPAGAAARGRQLRLAARLREGPRRRRAAGAAAQPADHLRRVQRAAHRQARLHRPVRPDRPARPVARRAPAARLAAAGGGPAARAGHAPVVPDRPAHVLRDGEPRRARRARRVRAAARARPRLPASPAPSR